MRVCVCALSNTLTLAPTHASTLTHALARARANSCEHGPGHTRVSVFVYEEAVGYVK